MEKLPCCGLRGCSDSTQKWVTVAILVFLNIIRLVPNFFVAANLNKLGDDFGATDDMLGMIYTAQAVAFMVFAPMFGYLGDRYSRRVLMAVGLFIWSIFLLAGSFIYPKEENKSLQWKNPSFLLFLAFRAGAGAGESSFNTIAPTIISDMFIKTKRSKILALYFLAIPFGSGLGYMFGAFLSSWQWGLRISSILGAVGCVCVILLMMDPPHGKSEGLENQKAQSYIEDLIVLIKNKSFICLTGANTCVKIVVVALSFFGPKFLEDGSDSMDEDKRNIKKENIKLVFGISIFVAGVVGVPLGMILSTTLKRKYSRADPIICGVAVLASSVFLGICLLLANINIIACLVFIFIGTLSVNMIWSILADMVMYIVIPTRRSTATAVQMFAASAFGDAGITFFLGLISKALKKNLEQNAKVCPGSENEQWNFFHPYRYFYNNYGLNTAFGDTADVDQSTLEAEEDCIKEG